MGQGATGEPNCWGEGGRRGEHKKKPIVAQGATGEHKEKPGWGIRKSHVSIRKSPVRIRKSPVRIRAETVSIRKSREHKGRDPQHKKKYHALCQSPALPPQAVLLMGTGSRSPFSILSPWISSSYRI